MVLPGGTQLDYLVDARNRRVGVLRNGVFEKGWSYRDTLKPSAQIGPGGVVQQVYVYGDQPQVPAYIIDRVGNRTLRVVSDERGSVRWVVDTSSGEVVQALRYGPWGEVVHDSQPGFQPFGYAGGLTDPDTGLVRFGARDYAPWLGRWTSPDPIGQAGGLNVYAYAGNDPINYIDPSGHESLMCTLLRELLGQVPGMQLAMALMDPNATAWDIAAAVAAEMSWNRALRAAKGLAAVAAVAASGKGAAKKLARFDGPKPSYHVNPAHVPGQRGFNSAKTPLPSDVQAVFSRAVPNDPKQPTAWFGKNSDGKIYRYSLGNDGTAHFSGIDGVGDGVRNLTKYARNRLEGM